MHARSFILCDSRVDFLGVDLKFHNRLRSLLSVELPVASQPGQRGGHDRRGIYFEMPPQPDAIVAAPESICPERHEPARQPGSDLIVNGLHEIGGSHHRSFSRTQHLLHVGCLCLLGGMEPVPALDLESLTAQFVVAGGAPDVGRDRVLFGENLRGFEGFVQHRPAAEQLRARLRLRHFRPAGTNRAL